MSSGAPKPRSGTSSRPASSPEHTGSPRAGRGGFRCLGWPTTDETTPKADNPADIGAEMVTIALVAAIGVIVACVVLEVLL